MIPCHVCGKDAATNWVQGFPPAPDSQKMGLCAEHDTPGNRAGLHDVWLAAMQASIASAARNSAHFAARGSAYVLGIHFTAGGSLSLPCLDATVTDHGTLKVTAEDGTVSFFPMRHIKRYDLTPAFQATGTQTD